MNALGAWNVDQMTSILDRICLALATYFGASTDGIFMFDKWFTFLRRLKKVLLCQSYDFMVDFIKSFRNLSVSSVFLILLDPLLIRDVE